MIEENPENQEESKVSVEKTEIDKSMELEHQG